MLLILVHNLYIDVTGVIAIAIDIWSDRHPSFSNFVIVGVYCVRLSALRFAAHR